MNREILEKSRAKFLEKIEHKKASFNFKGAPKDEAPINFPSGRSTVVNTGIEPYTGPWGDKQVAHMLKRLKFGFTKADLNTFRDMGFNQAMNQMIQTSPSPAPPVNDYNNDDFTDPTVPYGETWINAPWMDQEGYRVVSTKAWWLKNIREQENTIHEKMLFFWHNHLVTELWATFIGRNSYRYLELLRTYSLGNFKTLMKEITIDPAMLLYLNGASNSKEAPDENYARELQELFCIGKGPNANYTESDVIAAARVLTGWRYDWDTYTSFFEPWFHDEEDKQFSAFYDNTVVTGQTGDDGANELDALLDMIFNNNEVALFICRKLYSFFVYNEIDAEAEANVIEPLAQIFRDNNYEILPVLDTLFRSAHFFDEANIGAMIKSPLDFIPGIFNMAEVDYTASSDLYQLYLFRQSLSWTIDDLGVNIGDPPNVAGYPAYYQQPSFDKSWITTTTITNRVLRTDSLIYWGFWTQVENINIDLIEFCKKLNNPQDPNDLISESSLLGHGIELDESVRDELKSVLLSGQSEDYYWTEAWDAHIADPGDEMKKTIVENRLKWMFQRLWQLAEFQLM